MSLEQENTSWRSHEIQAALGEYLSGFDFVRPLTKRQRVLACLVVVSQHGKALTRFDSEAIGEHCLNSTIAVIGNTDKILVDRRGVKRPSRFGPDTDCFEYALTPESIIKAESLLIGLTSFEAA